MVDLISVASLKVVVKVRQVSGNGGTYHGAGWHPFLSGSEGNFREVGVVGSVPPLQDLLQWPSSRALHSAHHI